MKESLKIAMATGKRRHTNRQWLFPKDNYWRREVHDVIKYFCETRDNENHEIIIEPFNIVIAPILVLFIPYLTPNLGLTLL